jgi:hypothetical protein
VSISLPLACLAEGWVIDTSYRIAYWGAGLSAAVALASFIVEFWRGRFSWLPVYAALLLPHPGWRLGWREFRDSVRAVSSDCGYGNRFIATALLVATVSVLLLVLLRPGFSQRLYLVLLAAACWALHLPRMFSFVHQWSRFFRAASLGASLLRSGCLLSTSVRRACSLSASFSRSSVLRCIFHGIMFGDRTQSNQAMERTTIPRAFTFSAAITSLLRSTRAPGGRRSSCSR